MGVEPVLKAPDMADPNVEHLGVMAYAAYFQWVKPRTMPCDRLRVIPEGKTVRVHNPVSLSFSFSENKLFVRNYIKLDEIDKLFFEGTCNSS